MNDLRLSSMILVLYIKRPRHSLVPPDFLSNCDERLMSGGEVVKAGGLVVRPSMEPNIDCWIYGGGFCWEGEQLQHWQNKYTPVY